MTRKILPLLVLPILAIALVAWSPPDAPAGVIDGGETLELYASTSITAAADTFTATGYSSATLTSGGASTVYGDTATVRGQSGVTIDGRGGDVVISSIAGAVCLPNTVRMNGFDCGPSSAGAFVCAVAP